MDHSLTFGYEEDYKSFSTISKQVLLVWSNLHKRFVENGMRSLDSKCEIISFKKSSQLCLIDKRITNKISQNDLRVTVWENFKWHESATKEDQKPKGRFGS